MPTDPIHGEPAGLVAHDPRSPDPDAVRTVRRGRGGPLRPEAP
ncbi:hypothetical protein [Streptomyces sp. NPDC058964]